MRHRRQLTRSALVLFASILVVRPCDPALGEAIQLHRVPICTKTLKSCSWSAKVTGTIDDGTVNKLNALAAETRRSAEAQKFRLNSPLVELDTPGGSVAAAMA